jgi:hypothetical protein
MVTFKVPVAEPLPKDDEVIKLSIPSFKVPEASMTAKELKQALKSPAKEPVENIPKNIPIKRAAKYTSLEGVIGSRVKRSDYGSNGHWDFPTVMGEKGMVGFIYLIYNILEGKGYIGKKNYRGSGKINRGQESNWKWYISSSDSLSEDIKRLKKDQFLFICIEEYSTKGGLSYAESWSLFHVEAPTDPDRWYNVLINKVSWRSREKITALHKERLGEYLVVYDLEVKL